MNPQVASQPKILIVEDEAIIAKNLEDTLVSLGYSVTGIADTGMKAIMQFFSTEPDLILMDIRLKGRMDGIEAAERIRSQKAIPIVFLTAHQDEEYFQRAKVEGAFGYVLKPFQDRELQIVIEIALSQFSMRKRHVELEVALLNAEKLGTVGILAGGIVHDISNPLTLMLSSLQKIANLLPKDLLAGLQTEFHNALQTVEKSANSIWSTVQNYKSMLNATGGEKATVFSIRELCKEALEVCRYGAVTQGVRFKEFSDLHDTEVLFGRTSLYQVLVNLVRNACDAVERREDAWVEIHWDDSLSERFRISVIDSGQGIPENLREKIFEALFTTKPPGKGTGLGLSLCRRVLQKYGGSLALDASHPHTCFVVEFPKLPIEH